MYHQYSQVTDQSDESAEAQSVAYYSSIPRVVTQEYFDKTLETMLGYEKNAQEAVKLGKKPMDWSFHFHRKLDWLEQHLKNDSEGLADTVCSAQVMRLLSLIIIVARRPEGPTGRLEAQPLEVRLEERTWLCSPSDRRPSDCRIVLSAGVFNDA